MVYTGCTHTQQRLRSMMSGHMYTAWWPYGRLSQIRYSLVVILELNSFSEVQYKGVMMIDDGKYQ